MDSKRSSIDPEDQKQFPMVSVRFTASVKARIDRVGKAMDWPNAQVVRRGFLFGLARLERMADAAEAAS